MKKIIFLGPAWPYRGGIATIIERLAAEFTARGADVEVLTFSMQYPSRLFPGRSQFRGGEAPNGLRIVRCINTLNPLNWLRVGLRIRRERPDAVVLKYWTPFMAPCFGAIARIARRNRHTKFLVQLDNIVPHERRWFDGPLTRWFVHSMDGFICMSRQVESELAELDTAKPRLYSPHPIFDHFGEPLTRADAARALGLDPECRYVLFFGLIRPYKGLDMLIDAWAKLKNAGALTPNHQLLVAGEFYESPQPYLEQIGARGVEDSVKVFNRFIHDDEIPAFFSLAELLALPYRSATQSGVTQIALHFAVPVVATRVGGLPEIVHDGETGLLAEPNSDSLAEALAAALEPATQARFRANIPAERTRFSWPAAADAIEKLLRAAQ